MVTLHTVHTALKAHSISCTVDGFGSGMGNGLHYIVNNTHYQQLYKALAAMGFSCTYCDPEVRIYSCNNFAKGNSEHRNSMTQRSHCRANIYRYCKGDDNE